MWIGSKVGFLWKLSSRTSKWIQGAITVLGLLTFVRDDLLPANFTRYKFLLLLPHWSWQGWGITLLSFTTALLLDDAYSKAVQPEPAVVDAHGKHWQPRATHAEFRWSAAIIVALIFVGTWAQGVIWPPINVNTVGALAPSPFPLPIPTPTIPEKAAPQGTTKPPSVSKPLSINVGGVVFSNSPTSNDVRAQMTVTVDDAVTSTYVHNWELSVSFADRTVEGIHLIGETPVAGSPNLTPLDDQHFTPEKPTSGLLYFMIHGLPPEAINALMLCPGNDQVYPAHLRLSGPFTPDC